MQRKQIAYGVISYPDGTHPEPVKNFWDIEDALTLAHELMENLPNGQTDGKVAIVLYTPRPK